MTILPGRARVVRSARPGLIRTPWLQLAGFTFPGSRRLPYAAFAVKASAAVFAAVSATWPKASWVSLANFK